MREERSGTEIAEKRSVKKENQEIVDANRWYPGSYMRKMFQASGGDELCEKSAKSSQIRTEN